MHNTSTPDTSHPSGSAQNECVVNRNAAVAAAAANAWPAVATFLMASLFAINADCATTTSTLRIADAIDIMKMAAMAVVAGIDRPKSV